MKICTNRGLAGQQLLKSTADNVFVKFGQGQPATATQSQLGAVHNNSTALALLQLQLFVDILAEIKYRRKKNFVTSECILQF